MSKEQAAGEIAAAAAAEELLPADAGAVPEVCFSAAVMSNKHVHGMVLCRGVWEVVVLKVCIRGFQAALLGAFRRLCWAHG